MTRDEVEQRIDNFLIKVLKGVPKSRIYKAVRTGEVRVNGSRVKVSRKLILGDRVRIPPIRFSQGGQRVEIPPKILESVPILYEDDDIMVVNKPAGLAVHGGTGLAYGVIEAFRQLRPNSGYLELVHRIDRETSGCLMLAKSRETLVDLQQQLSVRRSIEKTYLALVKGDFNKQKVQIDLRLSKTTPAGKNKKMVVNANGKEAITVISAERHYHNTTLIRINLKTGRMHQARAHCAAFGHPIAGDWHYGDDKFNRQLKKIGLGRLFLHAYKIKARHPKTGKQIELKAALPDQLEDVLHNLMSVSKNEL